jgi:hypothetical protein
VCKTTQGKFRSYDNFHGKARLALSTTIFLQNL